MRRLSGEGMRLAGVVQHNPCRAGRTRCDMVLRLIPDGPEFRISQDLGSGATGCHLDTGALEHAVAAVEADLARGGIDMLIINKYGKHEIQGRGFGPVIGEALAQGVPVLTGVGRRQRAEFAGFVAGLGTALPPEPEAILAWCRRQRARAA